MQMCSGPITPVGCYVGIDILEKSGAARCVSKTEELVAFVVHSAESHHHPSTNSPQVTI